MVSDFLHMSITCRDLERSIDFYQRLGLKVTKRIPEVHEAGITEAFLLPPGHLSVAYLAPPDNNSKLFIDLVQWHEPEGVGQAYAALNHIGLNRFALRVSELDGTIDDLRGRGIAFLTEQPQRFGDGIRCIVTTDPDGVFIQLIEGL